MKLGTYLKKHRLSNAAFAGRLGVTRMSVFRYVKGTMKPSPDTAKLIVKLTDGAVQLKDLYA